MGGVALAVILVFYFSEVYSFSILDGTIRASRLPAGHPLFARMQEHRDRMRFILLMTTVFAGLATLSFGLGYSHRLVGPVHRIRKHIRRILAGEDPGDVELRQGDFFVELAEAFNAYHRARGPTAGPRRQPRQDEAARSRGSGTPREKAHG